MKTVSKTDDAGLIHISVSMYAKYVFEFKYICTKLKIYFFYVKKTNYSFYHNFIVLLKLPLLFF